MEAKSGRVDVHWLGLFCLIGLGMIVLGIRRVRARSKTPYERWFPLLWGGIACPLSALIIIIAFIRQWEALRVLRGGNAEVIGGRIELLRTQPESGHAPGDLIRVSGRDLEVSYSRSAPGYRDTIAHGGVLGRDLVVRLYVHEGAILRIDVRRDWR